MDVWLKYDWLNNGQDTPFSLWLILVALSVALGCSTLIAIIYRITHRTPGYSVSYVQTLILTSMVTALIMVVIGSNLARAFSLIGALSVIRFRNAIKETRDVGYIFFSMAIAMASGTGFFGVAILGTVFIGSTMLIYHLLHFGASKVQPERLLRVRMTTEGGEPSASLEQAFKDLFTSYSLVLAETSRQGMLIEFVYAVRPRADVSVDRIIGDISRLNQNLKVSYHTHLDTEEP